jgi:uncharacterized protein (DUF305 family)
MASMSTNSTTTSETGESRRRLFIPLPATVLATAVLVLILVGAGVLLWQMWPRDPGNDSAEAGFMRDMFVHHSQAVEMSMIIRDRTEDPELFALATDMALTQSTQMGAMQGYLESWGLPFAGDEAPMTWMGHPTEGLMPGMATDEQIQQLRDLPVDEAEVLFLQLMIRHHQGGVEMAEALLERSDESGVELMADRVIVLQDSEIGTMNQMLEARGQEPITDPLPETHEAH